MALRIAYGSVRLTPEQANAYMFCLVSQEFSRAGYDTWLTSANDSAHGEGSLHYSGLGLDFRTKHVDKVVMTDIYRRIQQYSSPIFDVIWENVGGLNEHLHIEYDPD